jgi:predicted transglutaminase-like cysteine proteinase
VRLRLGPGFALRWPLALAAALVLCLGGAAPVTAQTKESFWNSREAQRDNIDLFRKWTGVVGRHMAERVTRAEGCLVTRFSPCHWKDWSQQLANLKGKSPTEQLDRINRYVNRHPYIPDVQDYWETPGEFFEFNGDCEDYAIAKYFSLRLLGWPPDKVRIVVLQDLNLNVAHAVTVAYLDNRIVMLDNQIQQVVDVGSVRHYRAFYSINEDHWWLHVRQP